MSDKKMVRISGESKSELEEIVMHENEGLPETHKDITQEQVLCSLIRNKWLKIKGGDNE